MTPTETPAVCDLSPAAFARFAGFIKSELGIKMPDSKLTMVQSRLLRRVRELRLNSIGQYSEYFFSDSHAEEREQFINAITTNKTDFFREAEHFEFLTATALPSLGYGKGNRPGRRLNVWSAGCSSGEEAYTIAMVLRDYAVRHSGFDFAILGTDVSTRVLERARTAIYQESQVLPVPKALRLKYLWRNRDKADTTVRVARELRRTVSFHALNFMDSDYRVKDTFDLVFFRNVMIYFDRATQEAVINKICRNLAPGGYLFAGHSESLTGLDIPVRCVRTSIYRKI